VRIAISRDILNKSIQLYGAPEEWFNLTCINLIDKIKKQVDLRKRLADRGTSYIMGENKMAGDYNWMIPKVFTIPSNHLMFYIKSRRKMVMLTTERFSVFPSFVQNIPYGYVPE